MDAPARGALREPGRVAVVYGTRPEAVKLLPVVDQLGDRARLVHSGQHYDDNLAAAFERAIGLPAPAVRLTIGGLTRGRQIGEATAALESEFLQRRPLAVVVQGDTNSALAGALAASAARVPLVHVEAGLRSYDRAMPEEVNRVLIDQLADLCCAPTAGNASHLVAEGVAPERIVVTGNTVVDAIGRFRLDDRTRRSTLERYGIESGAFVLATFHRPENVDDHERLDTILRELASLPVPVVLPLHPRTRLCAEAAHLLRLLDKLVVVDPLDYVDFVALMEESAVVATDSGGVQEEASVVKRPVVVLRRSTERPEVLGTFATLVATPAALGTTARSMLADPHGTRARLAAFDCPFGDGHAASRIVAAMAERFDL